jgi:hypothetical protein
LIARCFKIVIFRAIKARYLTDAVLVSKKKEGHGIWVESLNVRVGKKFKNVWN